MSRTATKPSAEKRAHARFAPTVIRTDVEHGGERSKGYLMNLSLGGAFLAIAEPLSPDTPITLHALLPWGMGECTLQGRSVWEQRDPDGQPMGAGIAFEEVPEETRAKLRGYLERYAELASEITA